MASTTSWFQFSLSSQVMFYLLSLVNPYLSATLNIPDLTSFSFGSLFNVLSLITGRIIGVTNIGFINSYILPILVVINVVMAVIVATPTQIGG